MAGPTITDDMLGGTYAFKSLNPNDTIFYQGMITSTCLYVDASQFDKNIAAYNQACRQVDPSIPEDPSQIPRFFVILLSDASGTQNRYVFCSDWVVAGSWTSLNVAQTVTVKILDTFNSQQRILNALASQGYPDATITNVVVPPSSSLS